MTGDVEALEHLRAASRVAGTSPPELVLPRTRQFLAGRMRLHYLDWGTEGKPALLFLHGGLLTAHTWDLVCLDLRIERHCRALDQRGHGDSEWSPEADYRPSAHQRDVAAWLAELGCARPVLVGQSLGALNALLYAAEHGDDLAGVVLVDIGLDSAESEGARRIRDFGRMPRELPALDDFVARAMAFNPRRDPTLLRRSLLHNLRELPDGRWAWKWDPRPVQAEFSVVRNEFGGLLRETPPRVRCPVLVVRGGLSDVVDPEQGRGFAGLFPDARYVEVENAGHTVQGDNPAGVVRVLREFLAEIS